MIRMAREEAARALELPAESGAGFSGVVTDSRAVTSGMLFAALKGERVDGHDYASQAVAHGASALLVTRRLDLDVPQWVVPDVLEALGRLARAWRRQCAPRIVAITGSNGKTTTKELAASVLRTESEVLATTGNHNNELGVPLTLFGLEPRHRFAVLEMGASKAGDIRYLAGIAKPEVGLVTNVGPAHLQGFGDEEGVARAKGELYSSLPTDGFAIINGDEPWADLWRELSQAGSSLSFGLGADCDVRAEGDATRQRVLTPIGAFPLRLHLPGRHNVMNALAATAIGLAMGLDLEPIAEGLRSTEPVPGRLNLIHTTAGWTVIDDTYNANPASLYAALQVLTNDYGEPWLVLGDMKELGAQARKLHAEMGEAAAALGVRRLYAIGEASEATVDAFGDGAAHFEDHDRLIEALLEDLKPGVACLVKGSRSMAMEQVVASVTDPARWREVG